MKPNNLDFKLGKKEAKRFIAIFASILVVLLMAFMVKQLVNSGKGSKKTNAPSAKISDSMVKVSPKGEDESKLLDNSQGENSKELEEVYEKLPAQPVYDGGVKVGGLEPGQTSEKSNKEANRSNNLKAAVTATKDRATSKVTVLGNISLQYYNSIPAAKSNTISPKLMITNRGSTSIKLQDVKFRYYMTSDDDKRQNFWCDWSTVGSDAVICKFVKMSPRKTKADCYAEMGFTSKANMLEPGKSIEVQVRFAKEGWTHYEQTGDYSFNASTNKYISWDKVTLYLNGKLVSGIEP